MYSQKETTGKRSGERIHVYVVSGKCDCLNHLQELSQEFCAQQLDISTTHL
jgi:hypothetical protein